MSGPVRGQSLKAIIVTNKVVILYLCMFTLALIYYLTVVVGILLLEG